MTRQCTSIAAIVAAVFGPLAAAPTTGAAGADTAVSERDPSGDPRLLVINYRPDAVLSLTGFVGYHIHIAFATGEKFVSLAAGDSSVLDIAAAGNHLLLKAKLPTAGTNLTILTTKRVYFLDFRSLSRAPKPGEAVYSVAYQYPDTVQAMELASKSEPATTDALRVRGAAGNQNYWYCGSPALRPIAASDDGMQLRLRFEPRAELPAIYAISDDGAEMLVNMDVEEDTIVVHRIAPRYVLRRGGLVGCIVSRGITDRGRRATSGTIDEQVVRETKEAQP